MKGGCWNKQLGHFWYAKFESRSHCSSLGKFTLIQVLVIFNNAGNTKKTFKNNNTVLQIYCKQSKVQF